jgi:outer membrane protein OmpA-like peptidoglycan-associated protein
MESRFGLDLRGVRVHADARAAANARALGARAYTVGGDVAFAEGRYAPGTAEGDRLLAHELAHVAQQSGGLAARDGGAALSLSASPRRIQRDGGKKDDYRNSLDRIAGASVLLDKGVLIWSMWVVKGGNQVVMSMSFTPDNRYRGKTITFLQTLQDSGAPTSDRVMDVLTYGWRDTAKDDTSPFYGAAWDEKKRQWGPDQAPAPFRNQPGGPSDPNAYFFDNPMVYPGQTKMFETAVVVPETGEVIGFIKWGAEGREGQAKALLPPASEPSDTSTAGFRVALIQYYEKPKDVGPNVQRPERYDAILDRFSANDATLTAAQKKELDPIVAKVKDANDPTIYVSVQGFADATEKDPGAASELRAGAVRDYLVDHGVPRAAIEQQAFGAGWARFPPSAKEDRNRRVQVRVHWGPKRSE